MNELKKLKAIDLQIRHHRIALNYRSQDRIIQTESFVEAWNQADEKQRRVMIRYADYPSASEVKKWVAKILVGGLEQHPIQILRQIASYRRIPNYSRMSKSQLLDALEEKTNDSENRT